MRKHKKTMVSINKRSKKDVKAGVLAGVIDGLIVLVCVRRKEKSSGASLAGGRAVYNWAGGGCGSSKTAARLQQ